MEKTYILLGILFIIVLSVGIYSSYVFFKLPSESQKNKVKKWLLYAVALAEKKLGSGTGQLKLRYVYDMFLSKFPFLIKVISFETFSLWVDEALFEFEQILQTNEKINEYINKE